MPLTSAERARLFRQRHPDLEKANKRRCWQKLKMTVLSYYGGSPPKCACCGESETAFLALDHIANNGSAHRAEVFGKRRTNGPKFYIHLRDDKPEGIQVLCANCNMGKAVRGICPHKSGMSVVD